MLDYVYKDDCEIEVFARSSKNGAISQNALHSLIFMGQTNHLELVPHSKGLF